MTKIIMLASAGAMALTLAACNKADQQEAANTVETTADTAGAMASNAMVDVQQAMSVTPTAQEFVNRAAKSDAYEIAAARLALTNGASQAVKDFAGEMVKAHTDSTARIKATAAQASPAITPDATLTQEQNDELAELGKKTGAAFDEAYIDEQVDAHQDALAMMRDYAEHGNHAGLKAVAAAIAPVVQKHLDHAQSLDK